MDGTYRIFETMSFTKNYRDIPPGYKKHIDRLISQLRNDPSQVRAIPNLTRDRSTKVMKIELGKYRMLYAVDPSKQLVVVAFANCENEYGRPWKQLVQKYRSLL